MKMLQKLGPLKNAITQNIMIPTWVKYGVLLAATAAVWGHGYTKGLEKAFKATATETVRVVVKQGKVTEKVVVKYVTQAEKLKEKEEEVEHEGQAYKIIFPDDDYIFNNYFVRVFDDSLQDRFPTLSGGADADPSGVGVPEVLEASVNNNIAGRMWQLRAQSCEEWAKKQEELNK